MHFMFVVLNPLFSSCCIVGVKAAGEFKRARSCNALKSSLFIPWKFQMHYLLFGSISTHEKETFVKKVFSKTSLSIMEAVCRAARN